MTFITPFGRYPFNCLPFGITSAPEMFQFKMNEFLKGLEGVVVYMDDILVYGSNMKRLSKVLHILKENGLKLDDSKCHYHQSESMSKDGVGFSRDKVAAIPVLPTFLGVKSRTPSFCTKKITFGGSGGCPAQENFVILTSELSNFRQLLMIFFGTTEVSYISG